MAVKSWAAPLPPWSSPVVQLSDLKAGDEIRVVFLPLSICKQVNWSLATRSMIEKIAEGTSVGVVDLRGDSTYLYFESYWWDPRWIERVELIKGENYD